MANLEQLIAGHAYWSDKRRELKELGCISSSKCTGSHLKEKPDPILGGTYQEGPTCIQYAFNYVAEGDNPMYGREIEFDEVWAGMSDDSWLPCEHCVETRNLKKQRITAGRSLGAIRAAMTRIGRTIAYQVKEDA